MAEMVLASTFLYCRRGSVRLRPASLYTLVVVVVVAVLGRGVALRVGLRFK